ncbi:MAG: hypothetical protein WCS55_12200, partial [Sulfuricurvum sp.]|uniref:hypothetical protein n=1 Tax=Sulfuricurvum sp. TaxID=2025608 RepID=UPI00356AC9C9
SDSSSSSSSSSDVISALDTNQDGTVSIEELLAALGDSSEGSSSESSDGTSNSSSESTTTAQNTKNISNEWLQKILSAYGSTNSSNSTSLLSISA